MENIFDRFASKKEALLPTQQDTKIAKTNSNNIRLNDDTLKGTQTERSSLSEISETNSSDCHTLINVGNKMNKSSTNSKKLTVASNPLDVNVVSVCAQAKCKQGFTIPKKTDHQLFRDIDMTSREFQTELLPLVSQSFLFPGSMNKLHFTGGFHVKNNNLQKHYLQKKQEILSESRNEKEFTEGIAFFGTKSSVMARKICSDGVRVGNCLFSNIGVAKMGVCVQKYADVLGVREVETGVEYFMIIFKIMRGRIKLVPDNSSNLEPTPNYDCHISKNFSVINSDNDLKTIFQSSQTYLYEYGDDGIVLKPRHLLPIAVLSYQYEKPLIPAPISRKPQLNMKTAPLKTLSIGPGIPIWKGQLMNNLLNLGDAVLTSHNLMFKPVLFGPTINISHTLPLDELQKRYLKKLKHISPKREIHYGTYFIIYNQLESSGDVRFEELMSYLNSSQEVASWHCGNHVDGFLINDSPAAIAMGLPSLKKPHLQCHCLFISTYSMAERLNQYQGFGNTIEMNSSLKSSRVGLSNCSKNMQISEFDQGFLHVIPGSSLLKKNILRKVLSDSSSQHKLADDNLPSVKPIKTSASVTDITNSSSFTYVKNFPPDINTQSIMDKNHDKAIAEYSSPKNSIWKDNSAQHPCDIPSSHQNISTSFPAIIFKPTENSLSQSSSTSTAVSNVSTSTETSVSGKLIICDNIIQNGHLPNTCELKQTTVVDKKKEIVELNNIDTLKKNCLLLGTENTKDQSIDNTRITSQVIITNHCNNNNGNIIEKPKEDSVCCNADFFNKVGNWATSIGRHTNESIPFLNSDKYSEQDEGCADDSLEEKSEPKETPKAETVSSVFEGSGNATSLQKNFEESKSFNSSRQFDPIDVENQSEIPFCDNFWCSPGHSKLGSQNLNKSIKLIPLESSNEMYDPRITRLKSNQQSKDSLLPLNPTIYKTDFVAKEAIAEFNNNLKTFNKQILPFCGRELDAGLYSDANTIGNGETNIHYETPYNSSQQGLQKLSSFTTIFNEIASVNNDSQLIDELKEVSMFTEGIMTKITNNAISSSLNKGSSKDAYGNQWKEIETGNHGHEKKRTYFDDVSNQYLSSPVKKKIKLSIGDDSSTSLTKDSSFKIDKNVENLPSETSLMYEEISDGDLNEISSSFTDQSLFKERTKFYDVLSLVVNADTSEQTSFEKYFEKTSSDKISKLSLIDDKDFSLADKYITCTVKSETKRFLLMLDKLLSTLIHIPFKDNETTKDELREKAAVEKHILYERIMSVILKVMENKNLMKEDDISVNEPTHNLLAKRCFIMLNKLCAPNTGVDKMVQEISIDIEEKLEQVMNDKLERYSSNERKEIRLSSVSDSSFVDTFVEMQNGFDSDSISSTSKTSVHCKKNPIIFSLKSPHLSSASRSNNLQASADQQPDQDCSLLTDSLLSIKHNQNKSSEIETIPFPLSENRKFEKKGKKYSSTLDIRNSPPEKVEKLANFIANQAGISPHDSGSENMDNSKSSIDDGYNFRNKHPYDSNRILKCQNHSPSQVCSANVKKRNVQTKYKTSESLHIGKRRKQKLTGKNRNQMSYRKKVLQCHEAYIKYRSSLIQYFSHKDEMNNLLEKKQIIPSKYNFKKRSYSKWDTKKNISDVKNILQNVKTILQNVCNIEDDSRSFWVIYKSQLSLLLTKLANDIGCMKMNFKTNDLIQNLLKIVSFRKQDKILNKCKQNAGKHSVVKPEENCVKNKSDHTIPIMSDVVTSTERFNEDELAHSNPAALYSYCDEPNEPDAILTVQEASSTEDRNDSVKLNKEYQQFLRKI